MKTLIVFLVLAIIFSLLSKWFKSLDKDPENIVSSKGIVDGMVYNDGYWEYFVTFQINGETVTDKTLSYLTSSRKLKEGEEVKIKYYFTPKGKVRVMIDEDNMKPSTSTLQPASKVLFWISLVLYIITGILFVKYIFGK